MLFGTVCQTGLIPALEKPLDFLIRDAAASEDGKYRLEDGMFVEIRRYLPVAPERRRWECHERYVDLHCVLAGEETIYVGQCRKEALDIEEDRLATDDVAFLRGGSIVNPVPLCMRPGFFAALFPEDMHKTECSSAAQQCRKAVIKVPVRLFSKK